VVPPDAREIPGHAPPAVAAELAEADLLRGLTIGAACDCPYGAVCKHSITTAILAGERLDESPDALATFFGVTIADVADAPAAGSTPSTGPAGSSGDASGLVTVYDPKRQARLARALATLDRQPVADRDEILRSALGVLDAPDQVRRLLGVPRERDGQT
jgi:uncharacterized Zn finger protein